MTKNLAVPQAADRLGVSASLLWRRVWANEIPSLRIGNRVLIPEAALNAWVKAHTQGGEASPTEAVTVGAPR